MKLKVCNDKIKYKASLRDCVEFAFGDTEICRGEGNKKLAGAYLANGLITANANKAYKHLLGEGGKWDKESRYSYIVICFDWDEMDPETIYEGCEKGISLVYPTLPFVISVHENDDGIFAHAVVKQPADGNWQLSEENNDDIFSLGQRDYFEALSFLMY